jgi:YVTN family beta-propeller protein
MPGDAALGPPPERAEASDDSDIRTFLIADVRGYTRFTQERGDEAAGTLAARFAALTRDVVAGHEGRVLELRGDEALCVFRSARRALRAAVDLQARFRAPADAETPFPLGIGIGLAAGEAVPIEGGFRGASLNLAARLCALAKAGQILASETVVGLAGQLDGVRLLPRRPVRLKGIDRPVRLIEIASETPLPPLLEAPARRKVGARWLVVGAVAAVAVVGGLLALGLTRATADHGLSELAPNSLGAVDPSSGRIEAQISLGARPSAVAGGDGSVWAANAADGTVTRIDTRTHATTTIPAGAGPIALTSYDGAVWVANNEERTVSRIGTNRVVQSIPVGNGPRAIAAGGGSVWVANGVDGTVSRIESKSGEVAKPITVGGDPSGIAFANGSVWVTSQATGSVVRLSPSGEIVGAVAVGNAPSAIASEGEALWVANAEDSTVSRIDARHNRVTDLVRTGRNPRALAVGAGAVWVANTDDSTLTKIDLVSRRPVDTIDLASSPTAIAFAGGSIWTAAIATPESHRGGTLRVLSMLSECKCLDPMVAWDDRTWQLMASVFDGLVGFKRVAGAQGASLVPDLATTIPSPTDGGKTYTFQLRRGIRFSNGRLVRASDVQASLERIYSAGYRYTGAPFYASIVGADACAREPSGCDLSEGVEADDASGTVTIHLTRPDGDFLTHLALPFAAVVPAESPPALDDGLQLPGTGPYKLAALDPSGLRLVRNPFFHAWAPDAQPAGYPDVIDVDLVPPEQQVTAVMSGEADYGSDLPPERVADLATRYPAQFHSDPTASVAYIALNTDRAPFDDVRARRALSYAVDRRRVVDLVGGPARAQITCQFLPPNLPGYEPYCPYTFDPNPAGTWTAPDIARARRLVGASGTKKMRVEMLLNRFWARLGPDLRSVLEKLGYDATVRIVDDDEKYFGAIYGRRRFQAAVSAWKADYYAPSNFLVPNFACSSENLSGFCDRELDALIRRAAAAQIGDRAASIPLWAQADSALTDAVAVVPLYNERSTVLLSTRTGNFQSHPVFGALLSQLWVR